MVILYRWHSTVPPRSAALPVGEETYPPGAAAMIRNVVCRPARRRQVTRTTEERLRPTLSAYVSLINTERHRLAFTETAVVVAENRKCPPWSILAHSRGIPLQGVTYVLARTLLLQYSAPVPGNGRSGYREDRAEC